MPVFNLVVEKMAVKNLPDDGNLLLDPPLPELSRVLLRRLICTMRMPPSPLLKVVIDTGAPLTVFPHHVWHDQFGWRAGRDYDELPVAGIGALLTGQVLNYRYSFTLARLRVPVELAGRDRERMRIEGLVCQLAGAGGPPFVLLGLVGGVIAGRRLVVEEQPNSDDLHARLEF